MQEKNRMKITIFGNTYIIRSNRDEEKVHEIVKYAENTLERTKKDNPRINRQELLTLCVMNLCDDYFKMKEQMENNEMNKEQLVKVEEENRQLKAQLKNRKDGKGFSGNTRSRRK
ncbi:MAG: cell division protein ZapA [Tissierellia bacterium]|nr:cell division protein ZapA [Tissierellia bacterium]